MRRVLVGACVLAFVVAACGDDDDTSDALSNVCDQQEDVAESLAALVALDPTTNTTGDYQSALDDLESSVEDLREARGELAEQDVDNVTSAFESLQSDLQDLDDVVLAEADEAVSGTIAEASAEFQQAYAEAYANSSCAPEESSDDE